MFPGAKIIAIDDERTELDTIVGTLRSLGLACVAFNYPDERPEEGVEFTGIRVIFLDINLVGGASPGSSASVFAAPISIIDRLITEQNGPYALITWSSTDLHDGLVEEISKSKALVNKQPFYSCALSKAFAHDTDRVRNEVEKILGHNPPFGALLDWERRVSRAGERVLRDIQVLSETYQGGTAGEKMDLMLSRLAVEAFGRTHAGQHRFEAVNEALLPILGDALNSQFFTGQAGSVWDQAVTRCDANLNLAPAARAKLNSAFSLDLSEDIKPYRRGAILEVPADWLSEAQFRMRFGTTLTEIQNAIFAFTNNPTIKWVLVQKQAACDFAQPKIGPIPYVLAAIIPDNATSPRKQPAYVFKTPILSASPRFCNVNFKIWILNNIPFGLGKKAMERKSFNVLGRLKEGILESVVHDHHGHGSRPGFIRFDN
jgi:hypothetical protein